MNKLFPGVAYSTLRPRLLSEEAEPPPPPPPPPPTETYLSDPFYNDPVAFEGAMGYGANTTGGRGNGTNGDTKLYFVDNLNDNNTVVSLGNNMFSGSLRAALTATGKRVVVPRVGGYVRVTSRLDINQPNCTVLGQLAPGGGLAVRPNSNPATHSLTRIMANNVIVRYLKLRAGEVGTRDSAGNITSFFDGGDSLSINGGCSDVIVDHLSLSFATDGLLDLSSGGVRKTVQNCLLAYPLEFAGHGVDNDETHAYAMLMTTVPQSSILYNLMTGFDQRSPESGARPLQQWIGNTVYNFKFGPIITPHYDNQQALMTSTDFMYNTYIHGPLGAGDTRKTLKFRNNSNPRVNGLTCPTYLFGNRTREITDPTDLEGQKAMVHLYDSSDIARASTIDDWIVEEPIGTPEIIWRTAAEATDYVLDNAGHNLARDTLDTRAVNETRNNTGITSIFRTVAAAGGYPTVASGTYPAATDGVISNAWRTWKGESRQWWELDTAGTKRMIIENYADDVAQQRFSPATGLPL